MWGASAPPPTVPFRLERDSRNQSSTPKEMTKMLYQVTFTLHGKTQTVKGSRAQVQALCDLLNKQYRLTLQPSLAA